MQNLPLLRIFAVFSILTAFIATSRAANAPKFEDLGDGTFAYTCEASSTFNRDTGELTSRAKAEAAKYCASLGKQPKVISVTVNKPFISLGFPTARVVFKPLDAGDPELSGEPVVTVTRGRKKISTTAPAPSVTNDFYGDLLKLDDLRKKGILTDEEFQAEKKKILNRSK